MIEIELMCIAVLVTNEEVALFITQELRRFTVVQIHTEVTFEGRFLTEQSLMNLRLRLDRRMKTGGLANIFVNRAFSTFDVDRRLRCRRQIQLRSQICARVCIQEIPEQKQIEMGR